MNIEIHVEGIDQWFVVPNSWEFYSVAEKLFSYHPNWKRKQSIGSYSQLEKWRNSKHCCSQQSKLASITVLCALWIIIKIYDFYSASIRIDLNSQLFVIESKWWILKCLRCCNAWDFLSSKLIFDDEIERNKNNCGNRNNQKHLFGLIYKKKFKIWIY